MAAIITSLWKLAEKMGLSIKKDTIEEQINAMNKALEQKQENNIANALWNYADASGGGSGFSVFVDENKNIMYVNNDSDSVDLREIMDEYSVADVTIMNPISEIKVTTLSENDSSYLIHFVPKSGCKYYEDDTELNPNDMFVPVVYPGGQTSYNPNGINLYKLDGGWSPYDSPHETRKLTSNDTPMKDIIVE